MTELYIKPPSGNYQICELEQGLPIPVTYSIRDVREPDKRQAYYSKQFKVPGTANNNLLFRQAFQIGITSDPIIDGYGFNPNKKSEFYLLQNSIEVLRGSIQLLSISDAEGKVYYEVALFGGIEDIFNLIKDKKLTDIDWSDLDHVFNDTNVQASWSIANADAGAYVYPMIDYVGRLLVNTNWQLNDFVPAIFVKEYLDRIFEDAGRTYQSSFITGALFKKLIIPFNQDKYQIPQVVLDANEFDAELLGNHNYTGAGTLGPLSVTPVPYDTAYDPAAAFSTVTHIWTVPTTGVYTVDGGTFVKVNNQASFPANFVVELFKNGAIVSSKVQLVNSIMTSVGMFVGTAWTGNLAAGDQLFIRATLSLAPAPSGTNDFDIDSTGSYFRCRMQNYVASGSTILMQYAVPNDVLQSEFLLGLIKIFNLYVEQDRDNPTNYLIEPRDGYYTDDIVNWQSKLDLKQGIELKPMTELEGKRYNFRYKEDGDYWNTLYQNAYKLDGKVRTYGDWIIDINNDYLTDEVKIETVFSATPLTAIPNSSRLVSQIIKDIDANADVRTASNIKILFWKYSTFTGTAWEFISSTFNGSDGYPYAGHLDDPNAPQYDLSWAQPQELYAIGNGQTTWDALDYPDSNLFNIYWQRFMGEITDPGSRLATAYFRLTPIDLLALSFRKLYFFEGEYWRLGQIIDYDFDEEKLIQCEFLKAVYYGAWVGGTSKPPRGRLPVKDPQGNDFGRGAAMVSGTNNLVGYGAVGVAINGDNNIVAGGVSNVTIVGSGNIVAGSNVTLINTNNQTIYDSDQLWINNCLVDGCVSVVPDEGSGSFDSQTGDKDVITLTPATTGMYELGGVLNILDITLGTITVQAEYTDEAGNPQTELFDTNGVLSSGLNTVGNFPLATMTIRSGASQIKIKVDVSALFSGHYDIGGWIRRV